MFANKIKDLLGHTFMVNSNVSGAKVTFIVDPYDRDKDIVCKTPCKMTIPWEPRRQQANKNKILIEKDDYIPQVIELKPSKKIFINLIIMSALLGFIGSLLYYKLNMPISFLLFLYIYLACNLSLGSQDLFVKLNKKIT